MAQPLTIEDLRILAKRRVPRMFYDYAESGSYTESTFRENSTDFARRSPTSISKVLIPASYYCQSLFASKSRFAALSSFTNFSFQPSLPSISV